MKNSYPILLTPAELGFTVFIPDFDVRTQGFDLTDAIKMARDAIGLMGIDMEDDGEDLPVPSDVSSIKAAPDEILSLVDVDFEDYRRRHEMRAVRKNCTIPSWLCYEAEKANINFSHALQNALMQELRITANV